jgi:hypothetical protein
MAAAAAHRSPSAVAARGGDSPSSVGPKTVKSVSSNLMPERVARALRVWKGSRVTTVPLSSTTEGRGVEVGGREEKAWYRCIKSGASCLRAGAWCLGRWRKGPCLVTALLLAARQLKLALHCREHRGSSRAENSNKNGQMADARQPRAPHTHSTHTPRRPAPAPPTVE